MLWSSKWFLKVATIEFIKKKKLFFSFLLYLFYSLNINFLIKKTKYKQFLLAHNDAYWAGKNKMFDESSSKLP